MKKHSAVPWLVMFMAGDDEIVVRDCNGVPVARLPHLGRTSAEQAANANLIAAASELLAACRAALDHFEKQGLYPEYFELPRQLAMAISKADGGTGAVLEAA